MKAWIRPPNSNWLRNAPEGEIFVPKRGDGSDGQAPEPQFAGNGPRPMQDILAKYNPGVEGQNFTVGGAAKFIAAGSDIVFEIHYATTGKPETDQSSVGIVLADRQPRFRHLTTTAISSRTFAIPAGDGNYEVEDQTTLQADVDLVWIQPHMHYRGKDFILRAVYPSGETKTIVNVPRYSFAWQIGYELSEPVKLPKGTRLETVTHYDNSTANRFNPDPIDHRALRCADDRRDECQLRRRDCGCESRSGEDFLSPGRRTTPNSRAGSGIAGCCSQHEAGRSTTVDRPASCLLPLRSRQCSPNVHARIPLARGWNDETWCDCRALRAGCRRGRGAARRGHSTGDGAERRPRSARRRRHSRAFRSRQCPARRSMASRPRRFARDSGMRAIVLKNHFDPTAGLALLARKAVPGIEVFGGIDLNLPVGGMNAHAVEHMAQANGGWGRMVWMSTFDAENQVRASKTSRPFVRVSENGALLPETKAVIAAIAKHNLVLASGHVSAREALLMFEEGKRLGVRGMVGTHAMSGSTGMTVEQAQQACELGAFIEFTGDTLATPTAQAQSRPHRRAD